MPNITMHAVAPYSGHRLTLCGRSLTYPASLAATSSPSLARVNCKQCRAAAERKAAADKVTVEAYYERYK